jgi:hypothetical protein
MIFFLYALMKNRYIYRAIPIMKKLLCLFVVLCFIGCADRQVYENKTGSCRLELRRDSSFYLKYPAFLWNERVSGDYHITGNSILLKYITDSNKDSMDCSSRYYTDHPDTVDFSFTNYNDSSISVTFMINRHPKVFKTDGSGHLKVLYSDLVSEKIIGQDSAFYSFDIVYDHKNYSLWEIGKYPLIKPTCAEFRLNQYVGLKTAIAYKRFDYKPDTITAHGFDPKALRDRKLIRK